MTTNHFEQLFKQELYTFLVGANKVDAHLPESPDIEAQWAKIGEAYMPDAIREYGESPTVVFGWMMYIGMAIAKYWDEDWELYSKVDNLYLYLTDKIDFDHLDDYIRENVLFLNTTASNELQNLVVNCAQRVYRTLRLQHIEPGTKVAFEAVICGLKQMFLFGSAIELKRLGYKMTQIG